MRFLSVCSGIEAASVAWEKLGWKAVGFSEIEPFPCELLKQRFPNVPNYGDLTNYEQWPLAAGDVDILIGGPPCQAFSVAGLREGMADPRGNLSLVYFGLVQRLRPKWIVYENVPGLLSSRSGSDFSSLLTALAECGYGFAYRVLDASHFGLAQRRKRVFLVGCRTGDWRHPTAVLFDGPSSFGHPPKGEEKGKATASPAGASVGGASKQLPFGTRGNPDVANCLETTCHDYSRADGFNMVLEGRKGQSHWDGSDVHPTLNQSNSGNGSPGYSNQELFAQGGSGLVPALPIAFKVRCGGEYTGEKGGEVKPNERGGTGMLHYEDKTFTVAATQDQFVATPVQPSQGVDLFNQTLTGDIHVPLRTAGGHGAPAVIQPSQPIPINTMAALRDQSAEQNRQTFGVGQPGDSMFTLTKAHHHAVAQPIPIHDQATRFAGKRGDKQDGKGNGLGIGQPGDPCPTLTRGDHHAVAIPSTVATTTLKASMGDQMPHVAYPLAFDTYNQSVSNTNQAIGSSASDVNHYGAVFNPPMAVRRLLPSECEALQGFPRDWTKISWRGKSLDQCPDGPRYKAIGNSMATNCIYWIGKRIQMVDELINENK